MVAKKNILRMNIYIYIYVVLTKGNALVAFLLRNAAVVGTVVVGDVDVGIVGGRYGWYGCCTVERTKGR